MSWTPLILTLLAWYALLAAVLVARWRDQRERDAHRRIVRLHFPRELAATDVVAFVRTLAALGATRGALSGRPSVVFEVVATTDGLEHRLRLPERSAELVLAHLRTTIPGMVVTPVEGPTAVEVSAAVELLASTVERPFRSEQSEAVAAAVLAALGSLGRGEVVAVQWVVSAGPRIAPAPATPTTAQPPSPGPVWHAILGSRPAVRVTAAERKAKHAEPVVLAVGRIAARAARPARAWALVRQVTAVVRLVEQPGARFLLRRLPGRMVARRVNEATTPLVEVPAVLNARELTVLIAWPVGAPAVAGLAIQRSKQLAAGPEVPVTGRVLGVSSLPGHERPIALTAADSLHHLHVIGPTGVGKSTLLGNLIAGDLEAGRGVVVIDPKGDLVADLLDRIPVARTGDVIVLDPSDDERPVGLNLLEGAHISPDRTVDQVVGIFHRLYAAFWGPRTADVLHASLLTLAQQPGMTLCELPTLLVDEGFRRRLVGQVSDPVALGPFWAWFNSLSDGERAQAIGPVMNKLRAFLLRRRIRNVIGQAEPTWTVEDVFNRRRVLLVSLAKGELGSEAAALVGSLVVARLWQASQRRAVCVPAFVAVDEFQDVVNLPTDLGEVLAQARGFGVGLTLAHQHLGQLDARMKAAVLANARSRVVFQAAADDAAALARQLGGGLVPVDLMELPAHQAYVALCRGGAVLPPASLVTKPLPDGLGTSERVRAASRERYGRDRSEVEAANLARQAGTGWARGGLGRGRRAS